MNSILRQLRTLTASDLYALSEAIDAEVQCREELAAELPDSARRRVVEREQSYRRRTGSTAPPIRVVGIGKPPRRHAA